MMGKSSAFFFKAVLEAGLASGVVIGEIRLFFKGILTNS